MKSTIRYLLWYLKRKKRQINNWENFLILYILKLNYSSVLWEFKIKSSNPCETFILLFLCVIIYVNIFFFYATINNITGLQFKQLNSLI